LAAISVAYKRMYLQLHTRHGLFTKKGKIRICVFFNPKICIFPADFCYTQAWRLIQIFDSAWGPTVHVSLDLCVLQHKVDGCVKCLFSYRKLTHSTRLQRPSSLSHFNKQECREIHAVSLRHRPNEFRCQIAKLLVYKWLNPFAYIKKSWRLFRQISGPLGARPSACTSAHKKRCRRRVLTWSAAILLVFRCFERWS